MPTANLQSSIRVSKGIIKDIWEQARAKDFSFFGMCLKTNRVFNVDDIITVSLNLELDAGTIGIEQINARVARVTKLVGFYDYGLEFDKKVTGNPTGATAMDLLRIENILTRQAMIMARLSEQKLSEQKTA
jgi:hypothetical protein